MIEHTHNLERYAIVIGRKAQCWKRPKLVGKQQYAAPKLVNVVGFKSKTEAEAFKREYDKAKH